MSEIVMEDIDKRHKLHYNFVEKYKTKDKMMAGDFRFLKGNIETIILCSLNSGDKYGYEIAKEIKERTENQYEIKQPTLYTYLKRLESQGLIYSYWGAESNGGRRRYYKLTEQGKNECQQFMAEWKYHKTVLETLVDDTDVQLTQDDVTQLFGSKQKRTRKSRSVSNDDLAEQEEIARRIAELQGETYVESQPENETAEVKAEEPTIEEVTVEEEVDKETTERQTIEETSGSEADNSRFEVNQDNAEEFMEQFDKTAQEYASRLPDNNEGENYQHVLMNVLGDQLDDMANYSESTDDSAASYAADRPLALEDVADDLAKNGIRLRIYNRTTAVYRPQKLLPMSKIYCMTSWFTYLAVFAALMLICICTWKTNTWGTFVTLAGIFLLIPIVFTILMVSNPNRTAKPSYNFNTLLIVTSVCAAVIILLSFGINVLVNVKLSDVGLVATRILIPCVLGLALPVAVTIFHLLVIKYSD